ncbi:hypothetical protein J6590_005447, partial [Homalodisca vitripennis]
MDCSGVSDTVYGGISKSLNSRMSAKAVYLFVKRNSLVRERYQEWGVTEENTKSDIVKRQTRNSPKDSKPEDCPSLDELTSTDKSKHE